LHPKNKARVGVSYALAYEMSFSAVRDDVANRIT